MLSKIATLPGWLLLFIAFVINPFPGLADATFQANNNSQRVVKLRETLDAGGEVGHFAVSPDGKVVAAVVGRSVQLWDVITGKRLQTLTGFEKWPELYWSPDSSRLVITRWGKAAAVWFAQQQPTELQALDLKRKPSLISWSPDGRFLLTTHPHALADVWDMQKLRLRFELELKKDLTDARWNPGGSAVMTVAKDTGWKAEYKLMPRSLIQVWDAETGAEKFTIRLKGSVEKAEFSANGKYILTAGGWDVPELWDTTTGNLHAKLNPPWCTHENCGTNYAELSRDGSLVATGSDSWRKEIWDVVSGKFLALVEAERGDEFYIRGLSPDGRLLAVYRQHFKSWKSFAEVSSIQLYDTSTGKLKVALTGRNMMWSTHQVVWSSDSQTLVTAGGSHGYQGKIWDVATGQLRAGLALIVKEGWLPFIGSYLNDLDELSFHPTEPVLIGTSMKLVKFWSPLSGELLQTIAASEARWSKTGELLVTTSEDKKSLQLWELVH